MKKMIMTLALLVATTSALATTCPSPTTWSHAKGQPWILNAAGWQAGESSDPEDAKAAIDSDAKTLSEYADVTVDVNSTMARCIYVVGYAHGDSITIRAINNSKTDTSKIKQPPFQHAWDDMYECRASNPLALALCDW
jgi:hypothetical protein